MRAKGFSTLKSNQRSIELGPATCSTQNIVTNAPKVQNTTQSKLKCKKFDPSGFLDNQIVVILVSVLLAVILTTVI